MNNDLARNKDAQQLLAYFERLHGIILTVITGLRQEGYATTADFVANELLEAQRLLVDVPREVN